MTENQEKELFNKLNTLVTGVRTIQTDVKEIKETLNEHSQILSEHSQILHEHSQILKRLDAKTDSIAETVMNHEVRLTKAETNIEELQDRVHQKSESLKLAEDIDDNENAKIQFDELNVQLENLDEKIFKY